MKALTDITIILGLILVIVAILLMSYAIFIYIKEEKRMMYNRPLTNEEIKILVSLQPTFEKDDEILNKHVADKINVKLSWIMNQLNINDLSDTPNIEDEYKRIIKGIIRRE